MTCNPSENVISIKWKRSLHTFTLRVGVILAWVMPLNCVLYFAKSILCITTQALSLSNSIVAETSKQKAFMPQWLLEPFVLAPICSCMSHQPNGTWGVIPWRKACDLWLSILESPQRVVFPLAVVALWGHRHIWCPFAWALWHSSETSASHQGCQMIPTAVWASSGVKRSSQCAPS